MKPLQKTAAPIITLFTDGSLRKGEQAATWACIMKTNSGEVLCKQKGVIPGTAQTAEANAIVEGLLFAKNRKITHIRFVTDSDYCYKAGKEELDYWEQRQFTNVKGEAPRA